MNHAGQRDVVVEICRRMYSRGLISGGQGNVSVRLDDGTILITPSGVNKGFLGPQDLVLADMTGRRLDVPENDGVVSSEVKVHLAAYAARSACRSVVHAHPVASVALTLAGIGLEDVYVPESAITLGIVPTGTYATPSSIELAEGVGALARNHNVIMMARHGAVCLGADPFDAYDCLESLEHTARIILLARLAGTPTTLDESEVGRLLHMGDSIRRLH